MSPTERTIPDSNQDVAEVSDSQEILVRARLSPEAQLEDLKVVHKVLSDTLTQQIREVEKLKRENGHLQAELEKANTRVEELQDALATCAEQKRDMADDAKEREEALSRAVISAAYHEGAATVLKSLLKGVLKRGA